MLFDITGFRSENQISMEPMTVASNADNKCIAFAHQIFYEHDFKLFESTQENGTRELTLGDDYKFVFVLPGFRNRDLRYAAYAAVQIFDRQPLAEYMCSYRAVGTSVVVDIQESRRFFLANNESSSEFFGLLIDNAYVADAERLVEQGLVVTGSLIAYRSIVGAMEVSAQKLSGKAQTNSTETSSAYPTDRLDALFQEIRSAISTLQNTVVLSVNGQTPDDNGDVSIVANNNTP